MVWLSVFAMLLAAACPAWALNTTSGGTNREEIEGFSQSLEQAQGQGSAGEWLSSARAASSRQGFSSARTLSLESTGLQFYVSPTGANGNDGSRDHPWASIQYGVSRLQAGDALYLLEGVYSESASFSSSGRADAYITVEGIGNVVIDGKSLVGGRLASDPIRDDSSLQSVVQELGNKSAYYNLPAFSTNGQSYLRFKNLTVNRMSAAVEVTPGSSFVEVDGLKTDGNRFAVRINGASDVTVRNAVALNSWNAFRAEGTSSRLLFENIETRGSKDVYAGMGPYLNGDGFTLEEGVSDAVLRHIISADHWDAGFDIKASRVTVEYVTVYGNKNNFKVWGGSVTIHNSLSYGAKAQRLSDGSQVEGNGITVESSARGLLLRNVTLADNENYDIRIYGYGELTLEQSIVARRSETGGLLRKDSGSFFHSDKVLWNIKGKSKPSDLRISSTDKWGDPKFLDWSGQNYRLSTKSWAWGRAAGGGNLGAYEFQKTGGEEPGLLGR